MSAVVLTAEIRLDNCISEKKFSKSLDLFCCSWELTDTLLGELTDTLSSQRSSSFEWMYDDDGLRSK